VGSVANALKEAVIGLFTEGDIHRNWQRFGFEYVQVPTREPVARTS